MMFSRATTGFVSTALAAAGLLLMGGTSAVAADPDPNPGGLDPARFSDEVTAAAILEHLAAFEAIAVDNGNNRAAGTEGYEESAEYVEAQLHAAGYTTERQPFEFALQTILAYELSVNGVVSDPMIGLPMEGTAGTGPVPITASVAQPIDAGKTGCAKVDWTPDVAGKIGVVNRGLCPFADKSLAAAQAGAVGLIVINTEDAPFLGSLGPQGPARVPTVGVSKSQGDAIVATPDVSIGLLLDEVTQTTQSFNVLAETPTGREDNTVVLGAHLDGVPEGPGINDNGSGSAAILETALQLAEEGPLNNQVRFAWWGAEEQGLVGSTHYVRDLITNNPTELDQIITYLNFDMVGSPNYVMSVYDANLSTFPAPVPVPPGSVATEKLFTDYFDSVAQPYTDTEFSGRSDYLPFITAGVASSGLFTGAEGIKTAQEAAVFGGLADQPYDPNYHGAGDTVANVSEEALTIAAHAIGFVTASIALDSSLIHGVLPPEPCTCAPQDDPPVPAPVPPTPPAPGVPAPVVADAAGAAASSAVER
jgi:Zn-dependent M28 family amino/carboxypeptidase